MLKNEIKILKITTIVSLILKAIWSVYTGYQSFTASDIARSIDH